jgi:hypothetical protein
MGNGEKPRPFVQGDASTYKRIQLPVAGREEMARSADNDERRSKVYEGGKKQVKDTPLSAEVVYEVHNIYGDDLSITEIQYEGANDISRDLY